MIEVDNKQVQWSEDMTIATLIEQMEAGRFCWVVRLNGRLVSSPQFSGPPVPDHAVIQLLPLKAGG